MREVVEGMGSGVVGLQVSHLLSLGISSPWEGKSLQSQQGPKIPKHQNYKKKDMMNTPCCHISQLTQHFHFQEPVSSSLLP